MQIILVQIEYVVASNQNFGYLSVVFILCELRYHVKQARLF